MTIQLTASSLPPVTHRRVLGLALPMALANLTQPLLAAVDTAMAGHLPQLAALGGVALGGVFFNFVLWGFGFLRMGTTGLVAQAHGAGDALALRDAVVRALLLALGLGVLVIALRGPLLALVLHLLGGSAAVQDAARAYVHTRIWSAPMALANYVVLGYLIGVQRVRLALALQLLINLANMAAVFALVRGSGLGVAGIGAATAIADALGCVSGLMLLWRQRPRGIAPALRAALWRDGPAWRRLAALNRDLFLRTMLLLGAFGWFAHAGAKAGEITLAANALLLNFQTFMAYGLDGLAHAVEALTGEAIGARDRSRLVVAIRLSVLWALVLALIFSAVYALAGVSIIDLLTDQAAVRAMTQRYLPWAVLTPVISVWGFMLDGVFIGATRTHTLMRCMAICVAALALGMLTLPPLWGNHGVWLALMLFMALRGVTLATQLPRLLRTLRR